MHIMRTRNGTVGLLSAAAAAAVLVVVWPVIFPPAVAAAGMKAVTIGAEFCATSAPEARVTPADMIDRRYSVDVPVEAPLAGLSSAVVHAVAKGEVIEFAVASPRPGMIAVHGLLDAESVQVGGTVKVAFRAVYTGRFPLHFHGADGSHFEVAALEVLPKSLVVAGSNAR